MKKQVMYLILGILVCVIGINEIVNMSEKLIFPGIIKMTKEETDSADETVRKWFPLFDYVEKSVTASAKIEDAVTSELIRKLQSEMNEEKAEEEQEVSAEPVTYSVDVDKLKDFQYLVSHYYTVDSTTAVGEDQLNAVKMLEYDTKLNMEEKGPKVLIYHTHSQEAFADSRKGDSSTSIVGMGRYLTELLNEKGIETIHHDGVYDLINGKLDRSKAYQLAGAEVTKILEENPSIQVVIDLHRDGIPEDQHLVTEIDGKQTAKIMYFNGLSRTRQNGNIEYLQNPYIDENLAFSFQMKLASEAMYPGFTRKIYLKGYRYNLHLRPKSLLIEAGAQTNTVEEMKNAMEALANVLEKVLL